MEAVAWLLALLGLALVLGYLRRRALAARDPLFPNGPVGR
jgi:hypothetical protein